MYRKVAALLLLFRQSRSEVATVPLPKNLQCLSSKVFDYNGLVCSDCDSAGDTGLLPQGASICGCPSTSLQNHVDCSIESLWQGNCIDITCSSECGQSSRVASLSKQKCIPCATEENATTYEPSAYDANLNQCTCNNPSKGPSTGTHVVTKKLVEISDDNSGLPIRNDCFRCPEGTAVITEDLYDGGQQFFITAGRKYLADPYSCASCPDPNMYFGTDYFCVCVDGYLLTGEASIGDQSCTKSPSVSSNYSKVRFRDPSILGTESSNESYDFTLDSIVFSHLYLKAAAECEYYNGSSRKSLQSCQALANLCAMSMYDENAASCKQFETISQRRLASYHSQEDWKVTLPWLYYHDDEAEYITNDRGINMKVSFHAEADSVNILSFKLAKFTVDGTFVGIEDLANQFEFCFDPLGMDAQSQPPWLAFGNTYRHEYTCSIDNLVGKEMFLYDIYLVDESSESCSDDPKHTDCLYPVPVLNRNYVKDNKFLNVNRQLDDDLDDAYTRRFFLFDNQSGKTTSGTEAIRYAKKIVLQIPTQAESPNKLYPPKLIIEYATAAGGSWSNEKEGKSSSLVFKVEYSMETENFWASIQIMIGFIVAFAVVIFGIRMNNWQSRQRADSEDPTSAGSIFGLKFILHAFMIVCHIFVLLFFSFTFVICAYWFVFFKLQNEVFLLLPSENEFSLGVTNEYYFFDVSFRLLFWCQTIYVTYIIAMQCMSDIIFVDWERPRRGKQGSSVSMWRLLTIANEFNQMQSKRRSCIEFSLISVAFFMVGLDQHKNALPQPNFQYSQCGRENIALAFANAVMIWTIAWAVQWLWRFLLYERYINEPPATKFVDLCTVCNISVFLMLENNKGYYLHGRSPYQSADCSMEELLNNLEREGKGVMLDRGLDGAADCCQTFDFFASPLFRRQISKIYSYDRLQRDRFSSQPDNDQTGGNGVALARTELTEFLQSFIDQQPPPSSDGAREGLRYIIREPWLAERLLKVTPADFRTNAESKCILHPDNNGFLTSTFLGIEVDLFLHDILTYNAASLAFNNAGISIFSTYAMHLLRISLRSWFGTKNLSSKALIDTKLLRN